MYLPHRADIHLKPSKHGVVLDKPVDLIAAAVNVKCHVSEGTPRTYLKAKPTDSKALYTILVDIETVRGNIGGYFLVKGTQMPGKYQIVKQSISHPAPILHREYICELVQ